MIVRGGYVSIMFLSTSVCLYIFWWWSGPMYGFRITFHFPHHCTMRTWYFRRYISISDTVHQLLLTKRGKVTDANKRMFWKQSSGRPDQPRNYFWLCFRQNDWRWQRYHMLSLRTFVYRYVLIVGCLVDKFSILTCRSSSRMDRIS